MGECVNDLSEIHKSILQFRPHLEAVSAKQGASIKTVWMKIELTYVSFVLECTDKYET